MIISIVLFLLFLSPSVFRSLFCLLFVIRCCSFKRSLLTLLCLLLLLIPHPSSFCLLLFLAVLYLAPFVIINPSGRLLIFTHLWTLHPPCWHFGLFLLLSLALLDHRHFNTRHYMTSLVVLRAISLDFVCRCCDVRCWRF